MVLDPFCQRMTSFLERKGRAYRFGHHPTQMVYTVACKLVAVEKVEDMG